MKERNTVEQIPSRQSSIGMIVVGITLAVFAFAPAQAATVDPTASRVMGLRGTYYDTTGEPITRDERNSDIASIRNDPRVSFRWGNDIAPVDSEFFTAEWKGNIQPPSTGTYAFTIVSDGAAALWINDELLIEGTPSELSEQHPGVNEFTAVRNVFFEVGRTYHLRVKMRHSADRGIAQLWWRTPDGVWRIIPSDHLSTEALEEVRPAGNGSGAGVTLVQYLDDASYRTTRTDAHVLIEFPSDFQNKEPFRFDAEWSGAIEPRVSTFYRFFISADGPSAFSLNGEDGSATLSSSKEGPADQGTRSVFLLAGKRYPFTMSYQQTSGVARARLMWSHARSPHKELIPMTQLFSPLRAQRPSQKRGTGLVASYFNGENFERPTLSRIDPVIQFNWDRGSPKQGVVDPDHFSVRWEGEIEAPTTDFYQFSSRVDDRVRIIVNGHGILDTRAVRAGKTSSSLPILLESGRRYPIVIEYADYVDRAFIDVRWSGSDGVRHLVPREALYNHGGAVMGTGLRGTYYAGEQFESPKAVHAAEAINFDWGQQAPDPAVPVDHFSVRWTGWIEAPATDDYRIAIKGDDGVRLWLGDDSTPRIDRWGAFPYVEHTSAPIHLEGGRHYPIRIEYFERTVAAAISLLWSRTGDTAVTVVPAKALYSQQPPPRSLISHSAPLPSSALDSGVLGEYFGDPHLLNGAVVRTDPEINFLWGHAAPSPSLPANNFSVRWSGWLVPRYTEQYTLSTKTDDGVRLWLGERDQESFSSLHLLIDQWKDLPSIENSATVMLEQGRRYPFRLEYYEGPLVANAQLFWSSNRQPKEIIPRSQLFPAPTPAPKRGYGTGLRGRYYNGVDTAEKNALPHPLLERTDLTVDFPWGDRAIDVHLPADNFSVRWEGLLQPQLEGIYTFYLSANDSAQLWIDDKPISSQTPILLKTGSDQTKEYSAQKGLSTDRLYYVRITYQEREGDARIRWSWSHPLISKEVVSPTQLYPPSTSILAPLGH